MEYRSEGNTVVAKLDHGADPFGDIKEILSKMGKDGAVVISGIGMIQDFKLGYYDSEEGKYSWEVFHEPMELVSLGGSVSDDGTVHLHASVSGDDHVLFGGHLEGGRVFNVLELVMMVFHDIAIKREYDGDRDMNLLSVR